MSLCWLLWDIWGVSPTPIYCNGLLGSPKKVTSSIPSRRPFFGSDAYAQIWSKVNFWQESCRDSIFLPKWPQLNSKKISLNPGSFCPKMLKCFLNGLIRQLVILRRIRLNFTMLTSVWYLRGISYPRVLQWALRITKKVTFSTPAIQKTLFGFLGWRLCPNMVKS